MRVARLLHACNPMLQCALYFLFSAFLVGVILADSGNNNGTGTGNPSATTSAAAQHAPTTTPVPAASACGGGSFCFSMHLFDGLDDQIQGALGVAALALLVGALCLLLGCCCAGGSGGRSAKYHSSHSRADADDDVDD